MTVLIQQFFFPKDKIRQNEIMKCISLNGQNPHIEKITHLNENIYKIAHKKLNQVIIKKRLTFNDAVQYANQNLQGKTIIIANADIWFDDTLKNINLLNLDNKTILCNLRWERNAKLFMKNNEPRSDSQDFWIFKAPLEIELPYEIQLGKPGCDKAIVALCQEQNIKTLNLPYLIRGHHLHSKINIYKESMDLPRRTLVPSKTMVYIHSSYSQEEKNKILSQFREESYILTGNRDLAHCVFIPEYLKQEENKEENKEENLLEEKKEKTKIVVNTNVVLNKEEYEEENENENVDDESPTEAEIEKAEYLDSIIDSIVNYNNLSSDYSEEDDVKEI